MKLIKMLGLAAIAAAAMTAFTGAGTASATVLCKAHPEVVNGQEICPAGQKLPAGEELQQTLQSEKAWFKTQNEAQETLVECNESTLSGETTKEAQVEGEFKVATFTNNGGKCPSSFGNVKVTVFNLPWRVWGTWEGQKTGQEGFEEVGYGKLHAEKGPSGLEPKFKLEGPFGVTCTYQQKADSKPLQDEVVNGEKEPHSQQTQGRFIHNQNDNFELQTGGFLCPQSGQFEATYYVKWVDEFGGKHQIYIAKE